MLTVPILVYVFGFPMKAAVPMSLGVVGVTSAIGAFRHRQGGAVRLPAALAFAPGAIAGTLLGTRLATLVSGRTQLVLFALVMGAAALAMLRPPKALATADRPGHGTPTPGEAVRALPAGLGIGILTGLVGVGGGFLIVPALVLLLGLPIHQAIGTSLVVIAINSAAGVAGYLGRTAFDWATMAGFTALAIVGVLGGAALAPRVPAARLRRGFAVFLIAMAVLILLQNLGPGASGR